MIRLKQQGRYKLGETKSGVKILQLKEKMYVWVHAPSIGELLSLPTKEHRMVAVFSGGVFRLFSIKDEPDLVDLEHLELEVDADKWQSYLLLTGLPRGRKRRSRIIPTTEKVGEYMRRAEKLNTARS